MWGSEEGDSHSKVGGVQEYLVAKEAQRQAVSSGMTFPGVKVQGEHSRDWCVWKHGRRQLQMCRSSRHCPSGVAAEDETGKTDPARTGGTVTLWERGWVFPGSNRSQGWLTHRAVTRSALLMEGQRVEEGEVKGQTAVQFSKHKVRPGF